MDRVCVTRGGSLEGMPVGGVSLWGVALERTARRGLHWVYKKFLTSLGHACGVKCLTSLA